MTTGPRRPWAGRLHALQRRALPRAFREAHGAEMERVFLERLAAARGERGWMGVVVAWVGETVDLLATAFDLARDSRTEGGVDMGGWMDDLVNAARSLRRSPGFTAFAVGTLALGIGAAITFSAFLDRIVLRPIDFPEGDRLVMVWRARSSGGVMISPDVATRERVRTADVFDGVAAIGGREVAWSTPEGPRMLQAMLVDDALPALAGLPPILGRYFAPDELAGAGAPVVVLSEGTWKREFGADPEVMERALRIDGVLRTVVGVAPEELRAPTPGHPVVDLWLPLPADGSEPGLNVFARMRQGLTLEQAQERMKALDLAAAENEASPWETRLMPAAQMTAGRLKSPLKVAGVAVGLLLVIACMNLANLLLARGDARARDTAVRAAVGAGRGRLARELLVENLLVAASASGLGLALAAGALEAVRTFRPEALRLLDALRLDPWITAAAVGCGLATVLVFGMLPLAHRVRTRPGAVLSQRAGTAGGDAVRVRRLLLVGEIALSFAMLVGALQVVATLGEARGRDPGLVTDELVAVTMRLPEWRFPDAEVRETVLEEVRTRLLGRPGVSDVTVAAGAPTRTGIFFGAAEAQGQPAPEGGEAGNAVFFGNSVSPGWFETVGQEIVQGRGFTAADLDAEPTPYVLGESAAARYFPDGDAVGGHFRIGEGPWHVVVGVARDTWTTGSINDPAYPQLYALRGRGEGAVLLARTRDPEALVAAVRPLVRAVDAEIPVLDVRPVEVFYAEALARERLVALLLVVFAFAAAALAAVGLYGVASQLAVRRTREFGIRASLGAGRRTLFGLALRGGVASVVAGLGAGCGLAWASFRFMEAGIAGLGAADPVVFALSALLLAGATLAAIAVPALRAARVDPVEAMRAE